MSDENFDNFFGDKLKYGKNFAFADANWEVMEKNLQNYYVRQNQKRRWLWLLLPLLLLLGFAVGSVYTVHSLQSKMNDFNAQLQKIKSLKSEDTAEEKIKSLKNESTTFVKHDTIYHHVVVKRYDTIYRTIIIENAKLNNFSTQAETTSVSQNSFTTSKNIFSLPENSDSLRSNILENNFFKKKNKKISESNLSDTLIFKAENKPETVFENTLAGVTKNNSSEINNSENENLLNHPKKDSIQDATQQLLLSKQDSLKNLALIKLVSNSVIKVNEKKIIDSAHNKKILAQINELQPLKIEPVKTKKRFEIGISVGVAAYSGDSIVRQSGYSVGVRGNYIISKKFKLVADVQVAESDYQKNTIYYTKDVPYISAPTKYDVFSTVYCDQTFLNYGIGLQYSFTENKRINPYVRLDVTGQSKINEQFDYRFINGYQKETAVVTTRKDAVIKFPFLRLNVGAQFQLSQKISAQFESSYDVKLNSDVFSKSFLQLRGIVLYQF